MNDLDQTLKSLEQALAQKKLDYGKILSLAHDLAKEDQSSVRFSVDASHISRLGLELVSRQETAISELVKNSYDADAVTVDVIFKNYNEVGGTLEIIDSGSGMSREQLLNGFMRISTPDKVTEPKSPIYSRQRAGRKGIGRFAAQRLGKSVSITTQMQGENYSLSLQIDWEKFSAGLDLYSVENQISVSQPMMTSGTVIKIEKLRDAWTESQIRRAFRYVGELSQPFPLRRKKSFHHDVAGNKRIIDPGFKASFFREESGEIIELANDEQNILGNSIAKISGFVEGGVAKVSINSSRYEIFVENKILEINTRLKTRDEKAISSYEKLEGISFTADYFIQENLPAGLRGMIREILNRVGGVRIYRNGFRVLPYGENYDDWLGLQKSSALRQFLPPHHNNNFIGFVEITDVKGDFFEETASREGLIESEAFYQLQDFVYRALTMGAEQVAHARGKKIFASDKSPKINKKSQVEDKNFKEHADDLAQKLRDLANDINGNDHPQKDMPQDALNALADEVSKIGEESQNLLEEIGMLRVLASLGLTIGEFTHEVRHVLAALKLSVDSTGSQAQDFTKLKEYIYLLSSYMRYFDQAVTQNAHRVMEAHELRDIIGEFSSVMGPTLKRQNIDIDLRYEGYDLFTRPMHKSEWASTFLNLFTNSVKAIQRSKVKKGKIRIFSKSVEDDLQIEFSDNGDGISQEARSKIFDAFFSTSSPSSVTDSYTEQITGTGLGLKIVKDIIESAEGDIDLVDSPEGYSTTFRITLPRAQKSEIRDDQY